MIRKYFISITIVFTITLGITASASGTTDQLSGFMPTQPITPQRQSIPESLNILMACDNGALAQCQGDCSSQRVTCETGHDDGLPCEANYTICMNNCLDIADCK